MKNNSLFVVFNSSKKSYFWYLSPKKREILTFLLIVFCSFLFFILVSVTSAKISLWRIDTQTLSLQNEFLRSLAQNENLNEKVSQSDQIINQAHNKVVDFQDQIGNSTSQEDIFDLINSSKQDGAYKAFVMKLIPNGLPIENFRRISAGFGKRVHPIFKVAHIHKGIDFAAKINSPIFAAADGVVDFASIGQNGGFGGLVKITHAFGFKTYYAHLNVIKVRYGEFVKKGQIIAYSGNTGVSTAPHLHYEVRFLNMPLDPKNFITWSMKNYEDIFTKERNVSWEYLTKLIEEMLQLRAQQ